MTELKLNGLAEIELTGLVKLRDRSQAEPSVLLKRRQAPEDLVRAFTYKLPDGTTNNNITVEMPSRRPSQLPPPGDGRLRASLGEHLGHGRSGVVFALDKVEISGLQSDVQVPPLVVKVARLNRVTSLMREAWFYDEIECLQGVLAARCYGWFEVEIGGFKKKEKKVQLFKRYPSYEDGDHNGALDMDIDIGPLHPLMEERRHRQDILAVLVLERLGSKLPPGKPISQETRRDIIGIYEELASLGLDVCLDIRWQNILSAPASPPGLPSLPSPLTGIVHHWRAIDFEMFLKANYAPRLFTVSYRPQVNGEVFEAVEDNDRTVVYESDGDSGYKSEADWEEDSSD